MGVGLLIVGASRSRSDTLHSVVLLWTSDRQKPHLTTHKIHKRLASIAPVGIEPAIPANERLPGSTSCYYGNTNVCFNPLNAELNPICYLLALLAHNFLHVSRIMVKSLTLRLLKSYIYIYGAHILDVSRSHTTTHHSR